MTTVAIAESTINNADIGGTTPAAGAFTTLTATGWVTASGATDGFLSESINGYALYVGDKSAYNFSRSSTTVRVKGGGNVLLAISGVLVLYVSNALLCAVTGVLTATSTIAATTGMAVGNATPGSGGITFPATAVTVVNANTLDDYETGSFTPALTVNSSATGITHTTQSGTYTKVGNMVYCSLNLVLSSKGVGAGVVRITGLPFAAKSGLDQYLGYPYCTGITTSTSLNFLVQTSSSLLWIYDSEINPSAGLVATRISDTSTFALNFRYITNQ